MIVNWKLKNNTNIKREHKIIIFFMKYIIWIFRGTHTCLVRKKFVLLSQFRNLLVLHFCKVLFCYISHFICSFRMGRFSTSIAWKMFGRKTISGIEEILLSGNLWKGFSVWRTDTVWPWNEVEWKLFSKLRIEEVGNYHDKIIIFHWSSMFEDLLSVYGHKMRIYFFP